MTTRVLVVDDEELVRSGIVMLLQAAPDLDVVGSAPDGPSALALLDAAPAELVPAVVVTDLRMPGMSGIALTEALRRRADPPRVLVLTTFREDPDVRRVLLAGADGYLLKSAAPRDLVDAVRRVAAGETWLDPAVAGHLVAALRSAPQVADQSPTALARLTDRERQVLTLMAQGLSNAEVAGQLWVEPARSRPMSPGSCIRPTRETARRPSLSPTSAVWSPSAASRGRSCPRPGALMAHPVGHAGIPALAATSGWGAKASVTRRGLFVRAPGVSPRIRIWGRVVPLVVIG